MRYFPALFLLLGDIEEPFRFPNADLQVSDSPLGAHDRVVVLNHRAVQSPGRDVDLCARDCFGGRGSVYLAAPHERKQFLVKRLNATRPLISPRPARARSFFLSSSPIGLIGRLYLHCSSAS